MTTVKSKHGGDFRRFHLDTQSIQQFTQLLHQLYPEIKTAFIIKYLDEENDWIPIQSDLELIEAIKVANNMKPPILRIDIVDVNPTSENVNSITNDTSVINAENNCEKKESAIVDKDVVNNVEVIKKPIRKTIKDTVEEYSEGISEKSKIISEDTAIKTKKFSDETFEDTVPISVKISDDMLKTQESLNSTISTPVIKIPDINLNDDIRKEVSSKMDKLFKETEINMENKSNNTNEITEHYYTDVSSKLNDLAEDAIKKVEERTNEIINVVDTANSKVNTDVNTKKVEINNDSIMNEIGNKVRDLSINTSGKLSDISEDIKKNIMSI